MTFLSRYAILLPVAAQPQIGERTLEPTETICDLAARYASEDEREARALRFALKIERLAVKLNLPRHRVAAWLLHAGDFAALTALGAAA